MSASQRNPSSIAIAELMETSGVKFGTSGARGLVSAFSDRVAYAYTLAFLQHLEQSGALEPASSVVIAGDLRPSTGRILTASAQAISDRGHTPVHAGRIPNHVDAGPLKPSSPPLNRSSPSSAASRSRRSSPSAASPA